jgi:hypothetical protein
MDADVGLPCAAKFHCAHKSLGRVSEQVCVRILRETFVQAVLEERSVHRPDTALPFALLQARWLEPKRARVGSLHEAEPDIIVPDKFFANPELLYDRLVALDVNSLATPSPEDN